MKNSTLNLLAASVVSAGIALLTPGCCSSDCGDGCCAPKSCGCAKAPATCACATPCACADCGCAYGNWGLKLPYPEMNAGHLILEKGKDGKPTALLLWRWGSPTPADVTQIDAKLSNENFMAHAPAAIVEGQKAKRAELVANVAKLEKLAKLFASA